MSRISIDVDDDLLSRAAQTLGTGTKEDPVNAALAVITQPIPSPRVDRARC